MRGRLGLLLGVVLAMSCGSSGDAFTRPGDRPPAPTSVGTVVIDGRPLLAVGDTATLAATALSTGGQPLDDPPIVWSSSAGAIASIDARSGLVRGVGVGDAVITASVGGVSAALTVSVSAQGTDVVPPVLLSLDYSPDTLDMTVSNVITFTGRVLDAGSGTRSFDIEFRGPTAASVECRATAPVSGTTADGTWSCSITLAKGATAGPWTIDTVELRDAAGNIRDVEKDALRTAGFPTVFTLINP